MILTLTLFSLYCCAGVVATTEEENAKHYMMNLNVKSACRHNKLKKADWNYATNITQENLEHKLKVAAKESKDTRLDWLETIKFNWQSFGDYDLRRQFEKYAVLGTLALPADKHSKLNTLMSDMSAIYATAKICSYKNNTKCDLALDPDIITLMKKSRDAEELKYVWVEWRRKTAPVKPLFIQYVDLANQAAKLNNFSNNAEMWLKNYEDPSFRNKIEAVWEQLKPLYLQLHAYVRFKLKEKYGNIVSEKGPIPAHLLGNMWAQRWVHWDFILPYPQAAGCHWSKALVEKGYTPKKMFEAAEDFFVSLNLSSMTPEFWNNSLIEKPKDGRALICHDSAWDFYDGRDFRIKQCTKIDYFDFIETHQEMGKIQYYMQYKDQPTIYRRGANDAFYEGVGRAIGLSVSTPKHLKKIGLIGEEVPDNEETDLNNLFTVALYNIPSLPFSYVIDLWRWDIFEGKTTSEFYNCQWWYYRKKIQGVEPPVERSEADFDAAAKYDLLTDVPHLKFNFQPLSYLDMELLAAKPFKRCSHEARKLNLKNASGPSDVILGSYILQVNFRYFISYVLKFQFHQAACKEAGEYDPNDPLKPLHRCDIYQNKRAGNAIGDMLRMGSSRPWPEAMEKLTGQRVMDVSGFLEYFKPIQKWLEAENEKNKAFIGWVAFPESTACSNKPKLKSSAPRQFDRMKYFFFRAYILFWYMVRYIY